jgi:hypothetical protein
MIGHNLGGGANENAQKRLPAARRQGRLARPHVDGDARHSHAHDAGHQLVVADARSRELWRLVASLGTLKDEQLSLQRAGAGKAEGLQPAKVFDQGAELGAIGRVLEHERG